MGSFWSYEIIISSLIVLLFLLNFLKFNSGPLPRNWPLVGMWPCLFVKVHKVHDKICEILQQNDGTFVLKGPSFTDSDMVFTSDPANMNHILSTSFSDYDKGPGIKHAFEVFGDQGLFTLSIDEWRPLRTMMRKLFSDKRFNCTIGKLVTNSIEKQLIPILDHASTQAQPINFHDLFRELMFEASCALISGYCPSFLSNIGIPMVPFSHALDAANEIILTRIVSPKGLLTLLRWLRIGGEKNMISAKKTIDDVADKLVKKKQQDVAKSSKDRNQGFDVLKFFINEDGAPSDNDFLKDAFVGLFFAARDTTSITLTWFFWLLSKNPKVESKIRQELVSHLTTYEAERFMIFSIQELSKFPYLHAALCETLRLYPSGPILLRVPLKTDVLPSGHHVKPNMKIIMSMYAMGRMESLWGSDCLEFKPERWISTKGEFKHELSNKLLYAFSDGPRICPGKDSSFISMKTFAAAIIHNYNFRVLEDEQVIYLPTILLIKKNGLIVHVTKRWT